jgi:hypothetical protein
MTSRENSEHSCAPIPAGTLQASAHFFRAYIVKNHQGLLLTLSHHSHQHESRRRKEDQEEYARGQSARTREQRALLF